MSQCGLSWLFLIDVLKKTDSRYSSIKMESAGPSWTAEGCSEHSSVCQLGLGMASSRPYMLRRSSTATVPSLPKERRSPSPPGRSGQASSREMKKAALLQASAAAELEGIDMDALTPHWKRVKRATDKLLASIEDNDEEVRGEEVDGDQLQFHEIDMDVRREMMTRQNKVLIGLVDEHAASANMQASTLDKFDTWLTAASHRLDQADDDDPFSRSANTRPDATVGKLLNMQTQKGQQLSSFVKKMTKMVGELEESKAEGDVALTRVVDLDKALNEAVRSSSACRLTLTLTLTLHPS